MASSASEPIGPGYRPRIALTTYYQEGSWGVWSSVAAIVPGAYVEAVAAAGGTPLLLPPVGTDPGVLELVDGPERLAALIALIDEARHSLRMLYYTYLGDTSGGLVRAALLRAVDRGVSVSLLIDGFGSSATPNDYFAELSRRGWSETDLQWERASETAIKRLSAGELDATVVEEWKKAIPLRRGGTRQRGAAVQQQDRLLAFFETGPDRFGGAGLDRR